MADPPEFIDTVVSPIPGHAVSLRIEREVVEDDLGVDAVSEEGFREWIEVNMDRLERGAAKRSAAKGGWAPGEDRTIVIRLSDLD